MFLIFFLVWLIFNGRITAETIIFGVIICGALYYFCIKFLGYSFEKDKAVLKKLGLIIKYLFYLFVSIILSNFAVIKVILFEKNIKSQTIKFKSGIKSNTLNCVLANSITLTPGTYTAGMKNGEFIVHGLRKEFCTDMEKSELVNKLKKMEE